MSRQPWTPERVRNVEKHIAENNITAEEASRELKFSLSAFYSHRKKFAAKRPYNKQVNLNIEPYYNILPNQKSNKVVIVITDVSQVKNVINEMF